MYYYGHSFGILWMIVFWALIVFAVVAIVRYATRASLGPQTGPGSALDILKERYAKGEINKQEFEEKKKELS